MNPTAERLANATVMVLNLDPPPSEAEIDAALDRMAMAFSASEETKAEVRRILHARFEIRMDLGNTLTAQGHIPWLAGRRGEIDPFYWDRYKQLLLRSGWPPLVLATLDRATDELLDLLGNPVEAGAWKRRGLVMGDVQSGKTASYAALMSKAADSGYRMIILLTGTLENVRRQTQERLDAGFVGFDSREYLGRGTQQRKRHIGVGQIDGRRDGVVFTSSDHDFRKNAASALNISLNAVNEPVLVVTKKHKGVLDRLTTWLRTHNADRDDQIDIPLLLIDDEADNASVNTRNPDDPTSINAAIRRLLRLFRRSTYIGFTATPFANIFIEPNTTDEMIGDDLFPRGFIHVLEPPTNYVGMRVLFPPIDPDDEEADEDGGPIKTIDDAADWLPVGHRSTANPEGLPETLRAAVRTFLITCAVRDLREARGFPGGDGGIHRSMLVNVTHFTDVQNKVANELHLELEAIRQAVRLHGALTPARAALQSPEIAELQATFEADFVRAGQTWGDVLAQLHTSIGPVKVQPVNRLTGARSLDYRIIEEPPGLRVIAVGGNSLSRGLTLEGLSTSYFLRNSRAYDTLLQMGRWFGYREGYGDLCRLWMTDEAQGWYRHITEATVELKRDFARMKRRKATPMEFGLRVRRHPESLLITARNKMSSGVDFVEALQDISLVGRLVESARLYSDRHRNSENLARAERFFERLVETRGEPSESPHGGALIWKDVPAEDVADFLDSFAIHPFNFDFQGDSIADFLRQAGRNRDPVFGAWTVALPTKGEMGEVALKSLPGKVVQARRRVVSLNASNSSLLVSGKSARVGGKADVRHGVPLGDLPRGDAEEHEIRAAMKHPLLLVYLLRGEQKQGAGRDAPRSAYLDGTILPALGLHFPGTPEATLGVTRLRYRLNRVAQHQLLEPDRGDDELSDDPDNDD
jgi:Z1 domain